MTDRTLTVFVDTRETDDLTPYIKSHASVATCLVEELPVGDIRVKGSTAIFERKTVSDYASSIMEGRLDDQIQRMQATTDDVFILVEGDLTETDTLQHTALSGESIRGHMASTMVRHGIPVVLCSDKPRLVDMMTRVARKTMEDPTSTRLLDTGPIESNEPPTMRMYGCIDGVGPATAESLFQKYPSIDLLLSAPNDDLTEVEGIGEKTASTIRRTLRSGD